MDKHKERLNCNELLSLPQELLQTVLQGVPNKYSLRTTCKAFSHALATCCDGVILRRASLVSKGPRREVQGALSAFPSARRIIVNMNGSRHYPGSHSSNQTGLPAPPITTDFNRQRTTNPDVYLLTECLLALSDHSFTSLALLNLPGFAPPPTVLAHFRHQLTDLELSDTSYAAASEQGAVNLTLHCRTELLSRSNDLILLALSLPALRRLSIASAVFSITSFSALGQLGQLEALSIAGSLECPGGAAEASASYRTLLRTLPELRQLRLPMAIRSSSCTAALLDVEDEEDFGSWEEGDWEGGTWDGGEARTAWGDALPGQGYGGVSYTIPAGSSGKGSGTLDWWGMSGDIVGGSGPAWPQYMAAPQVPLRPPAWPTAWYAGGPTGLLSAGTTAAASAAAAARSCSRAFLDRSNRSDEADSKGFASYFASRMQATTLSKECCHGPVTASAAAVAGSPVDHTRLDGVRRDHSLLRRRQKAMELASGFVFPPFLSDITIPQSVFNRPVFEAVCEVYSIREQTASGSATDTCKDARRITRVPSPGGDFGHAALPLPLVPSQESVPLPVEALGLPKIPSFGSLNKIAGGNASAPSDCQGVKLRVGEPEGNNAPSGGCGLVADGTSGASRPVAASEPEGIDGDHGIGSNGVVLRCLHIPTLAGYSHWDGSFLASRADFANLGRLKSLEVLHLSLELGKIRPQGGAVLRSCFQQLVTLRNLRELRVSRAQQPVSFSIRKDASPDPHPCNAFAASSAPALSPQGLKQLQRQWPRLQALQFFGETIARQGDRLVILTDLYGAELLPYQCACCSGPHMIAAPAQSRGRWGPPDTSPAV